MEMVNDSDGDSNNDSNDNDSNSNDDNNNNSKIILTIMMVEVLSNLQFNFHHKLPLESLSKWLKS